MNAFQMATRRSEETSWAATSTYGWNKAAMADAIAATSAGTALTPGSGNRFAALDACGPYV